MRFALSLILATALVGACGGPSQTPEQKAKRDANIAANNAALADAKNVQINGKTFRVAHVKERNQALVELVSTPMPYYAPDLVAAARAATGCNGTFDAGVLAFLGGDINTADLNALRQKNTGYFVGWGVSLSC